MVSPSAARSVSLMTAWDASASCRPEAETGSVALTNVDAVSTHGPPSGFEPAGTS